jgi:hypothetical protein
MALLYLITVDLLNSTEILNSSVDSSLVENITYDNFGKSITFDARENIIINLVEFIDFVNQVNIFQTSISFNYKPSTSLVFPFSQIIINELNDITNWNLVVAAHTDPNIVDYEYTKSSSKMNMNPRASNKTISFSEWLYFLTSLNHYVNSLKQF